MTNELLEVAPQKNGWSEERRRKQAENIRKWRPWTRSTGPKTDAGKAASRSNAFKHGFRSAAGRELMAALYAQRLYVRTIRKSLAARRAGGVLTIVNQKFLTDNIMYNIIPAMQNQALLKRIDTVSDSLNGYVHPASGGRVLVLNAPYELPEGMDLRGFAGVVLVREQNPVIKRYIDDMPDEDFDTLYKHKGLFTGTDFRPQREGPRTTSFAPPVALMDEARELAAAFNRLAGIAESQAWFMPRNSPSMKFHTDGLSNTPSWRLTYSLAGRQTLWHTATTRGDEETLRGGIVGGFTFLQKDRVGDLGKDYFEASGALMWLNNSQNSLFHTPPDQKDGRRLIFSIDAYARRNANCGADCPFPCRPL